MAFIRKKLTREQLPFLGMLKWAWLMPSRLQWNLLNTPKQGQHMFGYFSHQDEHLKKQYQYNNAIAEKIHLKKL